jgi:hypothetical protein
VEVTTRPSTSDTDLAASLTALLHRCIPRPARRRAGTSNCSTGNRQGIEEFLFDSLQEVVPRLTRVCGVPGAGAALERMEAAAEIVSTRMTSRIWWRCADWHAVSGTGLLATRSC